MEWVSALQDSSAFTINDARNNPDPNVRKVLFSSAIANFIQAADPKTTPANFRSLAQREIALRGGATAPEVEMAATEEVARKLASGMR